jgi:hypothetical protein
MKQGIGRMGLGWKAGVAGALALFLLIPAGCRKKEAPPAGGGGETIPLNALSQIENYREILK